MVQALHRALPERGIGVWSFDFPAHGDSPMGQEGLRVPFCMDDLETVEAWIQGKVSPSGGVLFASSFGAYITLLSLSRAPHGPGLPAFGGGDNAPTGGTLADASGQEGPGETGDTLYQTMHTFGRCGLPLHFFGTCGNMICFPVIRRVGLLFMVHGRWMRWCP